MKDMDLSKEELINELQLARHKNEQLEAQLRQSENVEKVNIQEKDLAESIFQTAQVIILVLDKEGNILSFNPFFENLSGYKIQEVKGKSWFNTFLPDTERGGILDLFKKAVSDIQTRGNVSVILTRSKEKRDIEWYDKTLKDNNNNIIGLLAIGLDITERKKAVAQLETKLEDLKEFKKLVVNRENIMIELKKEVNSLSRALGHPEPYDISKIEQNPEIL